MIFRKEGQKPQVIQDTSPRRKSYRLQQEEVKHDLNAAVDHEDYELAAEFRDRIKSIRRLRERRALY